MNNSELLEKAFNRITAKTGSAGVINTGFKNLDILLSTVEKGSIITVGSRPSMRKTAFCLSIFENIIKQGRKCLFLTLDISKEQITCFLLAMFAEIDSQLARLHILTEKEIEKLKNATDELKKMDFLIADDAMTVNEIEEYIKDFKPEYVFIDYLQLIQYMETSANKGRANILMQLKRIAKENDIFIFTTSQLSGKIEKRCDKKPMLSDFNDTGEISTISDVVIFPYRDEYYNKEESQKTKKYAEIIIAKNKFGPIDIIQLYFSRKTNKFYDLQDKS